MSCRIRLVAAALLSVAACVRGFAGTPDDDANMADYQRFRDAVIGYVRADADAYLAGTPAPSMQPAEFDHSGRWSVEVAVYLDGTLRGLGQSRADHLSGALHASTVTALSGETFLTPRDLMRARFVVTFVYPPRRAASIVEYHGRGLELMGDVVPLRELDRSMVEDDLERAKRYLLRIMDGKLHGFPKTDDAATDTAEDRLRTIYTASSLYTLLKLDTWKPDPAIQQQILPIARYLLSMQCLEGPCRGAFYYSYFPAEDRREPRFVVGTASKTVFTLLELWRRTQDEQYLASARLAGDWLTTMVNPDGSLSAAIEYKEGSWSTERRFSLLYSGQVLSALSRLYTATRDERYRNAAGRIASLCRTKMASANGHVLGDDFREANSVSTSWVAKAMFDYSRIDGDPSDHDVVYRALNAVLAHQVDTPWDPYVDGSIYDAPSSSGTGWINEVLTDVYQLCREDGRADCDRYRLAMLHASRWLLQRTYSEANAFNARNPAHAAGGAIRSYGETIIRTDAVCHGSNSLLELLSMAGDDIHLTLPPPPFGQFFRALRSSMEHG